MPFRAFDSLGHSFEALMTLMLAGGLTEVEATCMRALAKRIEDEDAPISVLFAVVASLGLTRFREVTRNAPGVVPNG